MKLSDDRISHLAHLIIDTLYKDDLVDYPDDNDQEALRATKRFLRDHFNLEEQADEAARKKIESQSKTIIEGSREWDVLYKKYFEEELNKRST